jgi:hypothetical protein
MAREFRRDYGRRRSRWRRWSCWKGDVRGHRPPPGGARAGPGPSVAAEANYRIAEIYIALGQRNQAMGHLTTAQAKAPEGIWGRRSEEYLKLLR